MGRAILIDENEADRARVREVGSTISELVAIDEAATPSDAFARLEATRYDVALIKLARGDQPAAEVIAHLRERWPTLPCVVLTAIDDPENVNAALRAGAIDHVPKADLARRLEHVVRNALRVGAAESALAESREALERQVGMLGSLVEVAAQVHRSATAEDAIDTTVRAASALFGARALLRLTFEGRQFIGEQDPFVSEETPLDASMVVSVAALQGELAGELRCERIEPPFERAEELAAGQLARTAAVAIERHALLGVARARAREREEIVAIVSHDLRAPLQTFAFAVEALRAAPSRAILDEILVRITRTMRQMWRLLDDLLDVSRLQDGQLVVHPRLISVASVVTQVIEQAVGLATQRDVLLRAEPVGAELQVLADETRLQQAISNLLGNAVRHARSRVTLRVTEEERAIRFDVVDDGAGVDPTIRARLFERLSQGGAGRGSLGLGLYIVRGIVHSHHGTVGVDDVPEGGSAFWIRLPRPE